MKHLLKLGIFALVLSLNACVNSEKTESAADLSIEMAAIADQLKSDENNSYLKTLKPTAEDLKAIFKENGTYKQMLDYSNSNWKKVDNIPPNAMKPSEEGAKLIIHTLSDEDLKAAKNGGFPIEYLGFAKNVNDGIVFYGMQYLKSDGSEDIFRSAFFKVNDRWVFIPLPYLGL